MSAQLFQNDILYWQRFLSCCGFYTDELDGFYGPHTSAAEAAFDEATEAIATQEGRFEPRSEGNIRSLQTRAQVLARRSLAALRKAGFGARIISGTRSYAQQNALFRQGRFGNPGPRVTNARGGRSWHNFGLAWDIGLFDGGTYLTDETLYEQAAPIARLPGLEWGGDWTSFRDRPHYQLATGGKPISAERAMFEAGYRP